MNTGFYFEILNAEDLSYWDRLVLRWLDWRARSRCPEIYEASSEAWHQPSGVFEVEEDWEVLFHMKLFRRMSRRTKAIIRVCAMPLCLPVIFEKGQDRFWRDEMERHPRLFDW